MLFNTVRTWFTRAAGLPPLLEPGLVEAIERLPEQDGKPLAPLRPTSETWPPERLTVAELLWGEGFVRPGGAPEVTRLGRPLISTSSFSLLLVGAGPGGAGLAFAKELGLWVTAFEADPALAAVATERIRRTKLSKRVETRGWDPQAPAFGPDTYHHAICLEPLCGRPVVPLLTACAAALRPAAQIVLTELVADEPLGRQDPAMLAWARLEPSRGPELPTERDISRALTRLGFDVRVAEDITGHHLECCLHGWRLLVRELKRDNLPLARAYCMVREAELWMNRLKLMQQGKLRLVRWHAFSRAGAGAGVLLAGPAAPH